MSLKEEEDEECNHIIAGCHYCFNRCCVFDRINLYYKVSKPCYVKIVITRPDGKSTIGPT
jgi:hypothetical protein